MILVSSDLSDGSDPSDFSDAIHRVPTCCPAILAPPFCPAILAPPSCPAILAVSLSFGEGWGEVLNPPFCPVAAVKVAVADGLGDMVALHTLRVVEVGDGARHLEDAVVGAC